MDKGIDAAVHQANQMPASVCVPSKNNGVKKQPQSAQDRSIPAPNADPILKLEHTPHRREACTIKKELHFVGPSGN